MYSSLFQLNFSTSYLVICFRFFEQGWRQALHEWVQQSAHMFLLGAKFRYPLSVYSLQHDIPDSDL
jgi:hypothetical protein